MNQLSLILSVPEAHSGLVNETVTLKSVSVFGIGHLGSNIVNILGKIGVPEFNLYDFDELENRNISGGPFLASQIGMKKVSAMKDIIENRNLEPKLIHTFDKEIKSRSKIVATDYYILATDSIEARLGIFNAISKLKGHVIDIRSRGTLGMVYSFSLSDEIAKIWYLKSMKAQLKDPTEPVHCNEANIIFSSYIIGSVATKILLDTLEDDHNLRGYKIDSTELTILELPMNYDALVKKYSKQIKVKCKYCGKSHKTDAAKEKCKKSKESKEAEKKRKAMPNRSQFI